MWRLTGLVAAGLFAVACGGDPEGTVTRDQFEKDGLTWPLTEDRVVLDCEAGAVSVRTNDGFYGVNGIATSKGFPPLDDLQLDDTNAEVPEGAETPKVSAIDLIDAGLALCED